MADCDVAVIGAGAVGGAVAYELSMRGVSVILLDARGSGLGSTQAAAGMLVPFIEGFGRPILPLATRSLEMYAWECAWATRNQVRFRLHSRTRPLTN